MTKHRGNVMIDFFGGGSIKFVCDCGLWLRRRRRRSLYKKLREESGRDSLDGTSCEVLSVCICQRGLHDLETQQSASERALVSHAVQTGLSRKCLHIYSQIISSIQKCLLLLSGQRS